jgi:hypothetical protein
MNNLFQCQSALFIYTVLAQNEIKIMIIRILPPTVSRSVCLGVKPQSRPQNQILLLSVVGSLIRSALSEEKLCLFFWNYCWPSPAQSFSVRFPRDSWLRFTVSGPTLPQPWRPYPHSHVPQEPSHTSEHWVPFSSPSLIDRYSNTAPRWYSSYIKHVSNNIGMQFVPHRKLCLLWQTYGTQNYTVRAKCTVS